MIHDKELRLDIRLYLTFLQNTITRMGDYGKTCKQFSITILTSSFVFIGVLIEKNSFTWYTSIWVFIPILLFWTLDTFFLQTERKYRNKYNDYVQQYRDSLNSVDNVSKLINNLYNMSSESNNTHICWCSVFFSKTFCIMYVSQIYVWIFFCGLVVGLLK